MPKNRLLKLIRESLSIDPPSTPAAAERQVVAQETLAVQLALTQGVLEGTPDGVLVVDFDGHVLLWNDNFRRMWGISQEAAESRDDSRLLDEAFGQLVDPEGFMARVRELYAMPEASTEAEDIALRNGRTFVRRSRPVRVEGRPIARMWVFHDDTGARETARARASLEEKLKQAQKLEAIGKLAGAIAHDFNNLLTAMRGYNELLQQRTPAEDPRRAYADEVGKAISRASALTRQLLAFSRGQVLEPRRIDLGAIVEEFEPMLHRLLGESIRLEITRAEAASTAMADRGQIEQVLLNLVVNARDAMPEGGVIRIASHGVDLDEEGARRLTGLTAGPHVVVEVSDTGSGMDPATVSRIFEPFFSTKLAGRGTGLGLATVYGIAKQSGGHIEVETAPGAGSTFRLYLRRVDGPSDELQGGPASALQNRGNETILLVEDDDAVRDLTTRMLSGLGYTVISARHPGEAIVACERHPGEIHLVLTDMIMPHMNGKELRERVRQVRPGLRAVYMSGYIGFDERDKPSDIEGRFLQKPFNLEDLSRKVREILDAV